MRVDTADKVLTASRSPSLSSYASAHLGGRDRHVVAIAVAVIVAVIVIVIVPLVIALFPGQCREIARGRLGREREEEGRGGEGRGGDGDGDGDAHSVADVPPPRPFVPTRAASWCCPSYS